LLIKGDMMSRLNELSQALITIIISFHENQAAPCEKLTQTGAKQLLKKPPTEIKRELAMLIDSSSKKGDENNTVLHCVLDTLFQLTVFLNPTEKQQSNREALEKQLITLIIRVAKELDFVFVDDEKETSETLSQEILSKLLLVLGLEPHEQDIIEQRIKSTLDEHQHVTRLLQANSCLTTENKRLLKQYTSQAESVTERSNLGRERFGFQFDSFITAIKVAGSDIASLFAGEDEEEPKERSPYYPSGAFMEHQ
jgi:hypothetical protein